MLRLTFRKASQSSILGRFHHLTQRNIIVGAQSSSSTSSVVVVPVCRHDWNESKMLFSTNINININTDSDSNNSTNKSDVGEVEESPKKTAFEGIPTRHSRHHIPSIAPVTILNDATQEILNSTPGSLFAYDSNNMNRTKQQEYEAGLEVSHYHTEHLEYILRGYSSLISNSITQIQYQSKAKQINKNMNMNMIQNQLLEKTNNNDPSKVDMDEMEIVENMIALVHRMEEEGRVYVQLRSKMRSQLALLHQNRHNHDDSGSSSNNSSSSSSNSGSTSNSNNSDSDSSGTSDDEDIEESTKQAWQMTRLISNYGSPPGVSTPMYDLTLDAISNIISKSTTSTTTTTLSLLYQARTLYATSLSNHKLDVDQKLEDMNIKCIPSAATFNTLIRISNNVDMNLVPEELQDEVRDVAIENAFLAYDAMGHHKIVERNNATYFYLLRVVNKYFPDCVTKGNIMVGLFDKCLSEGVLDENVLHCMMEDVNSKDCGNDFDNYIQNRLKDKVDFDVKNGFGLPMKFGKNKKSRRYDKRLTVY